ARRRSRDRHGGHRRRRRRRGAGGRAVVELGRILGGERGGRDWRPCAGVSVGKAFGRRSYRACRRGYRGHRSGRSGRLGAGGTGWRRGKLTKLLLTRHGETDWNLARRIQGWSDTPL